MKTILGALLLTFAVIGAAHPSIVFAEDAVLPTGESVEAVAQKAEDTVSEAIPEEAKTFFNTLFARIETFRLQQVVYATAKRDALSEVVAAQQAQKEEAVEENRDDVLDGDVLSLYSDAGERLKMGASFGVQLQYYGYKYYAMFVTSPIMFYVVGSFLLLYILSTIFRRFGARRVSE